MANPNASEGIFSLLCCGIVSKKKIMRLLPRLLVLAGLVYLCVVLFHEGRRLEASGALDQSRLFLIFGGALISAIAAGIIVAVTFLPMLGEKVGEMIYGTKNDAAHDPFFMAHEAIADGNYDEAISFYRQALAADADDTAAIEGIAEVQTKYLGDPDAAAGLLETALERSWPADEDAFLRCKLAEVYGRHQGDMGKARELLLGMMEAYPGTAQARNAEHLLHELEAS